MFDNKLVLAIEIGKDYIKGVRFRSSLKGPHFEGAGFTSLSVKEEEGWNRAANNGLTLVFDKMKPEKTEVISIMPGHLFFLRNYSFPMTNQRKVKQAIPFEMEGDIPLPLEDVVIDSVVIKEKKGAKVFAFALPKEIFKEHLNLFPEGFKPRIVIPDFVSLSFLKLSEQKEDTGILEVGDEKLTLIASKHSKLKAARSIASKNKDGLSNSDITELDSTLKEWARTGIDIKKIYLCGDNTSNVDNEDLSDKLDLDLEDLAPSLNSIGQISTKKKDYDKLKEPSRFASLIGAGYINIDVNLLRSEEEEERAAVLRKRVITSSIGLAILLLLGLTDLFITYSSIKGQYSEAKLAVSKAFQEAMPEVKNIPIGKEKAQLETAIKKEKESLRLIKGDASIDFDLLKVLDSFISEPLTGNVVITELRIEKEISFQGEAKKQGAIDTFVESLRKASTVKDVTIKRIEHIVDSFRFLGTATVEDGD
jgi:hypothetical protein